MIKHHPSQLLLVEFTAGKLGAGLSAAIAMHAERCPQCQKLIQSLEEEHVATHFLQEDTFDVLTSNQNMDFLDFDQLIMTITANDDVDEPLIEQSKSLTFCGQDYKLPKALQHVSLGKSSVLGKLTRTRINLEEEPARSGLLHMQSGGSIPPHSHKGTEVTLILEGSFSDDMGHYQAGDFILLDNTHQHSPYSEDGCLCYTVVDDALTFTEGFAKILNPIGQLIY